MITIGQTFPAFSLQNQDGKLCTNADFLGKWTVMYFYPKDNTPGCTIEAHGFQQMLPAFHKLQAEVVGISKDTAKSHRKFCDSQGLQFTLLSDPEKKLYADAEIHTKKMMGHTMYKRSTYIVDPKGIVRAAIEDVSPLGHAEECLAFIKAHAK